MCVLYTYLQLDRLNEYLFEISVSPHKVNIQLQAMVCYFRIFQSDKEG